MTIAHKTGLVALAVAAMVAALLMPPTTASANEDVVDDSVVALIGTAHLSQGINVPPKEDGCLGGVAVGLGTENNFDPLDPGFVVADGIPVLGPPNAGAQFGYGNTQVQGVANGELWIDGLNTRTNNREQAKTEFDWTRVGTIALVTLGDDKKGGDEGNEYGVAVGTLTPVDIPLFPCTGEKKDKTDIVHGNWPNDVHVQIVGVGVILRECNPPSHPKPGALANCNVV